MVRVDYSYDYDEGIKTFVFLPNAKVELHGQHLPNAKVGLHGQPWPRFIMDNGNQLNPIQVASPEVNNAANEVAAYMNKRYSYVRMDSKDYCSVLSNIASIRFGILMKRLVEV